MGTLKKSVEHIFGAMRSVEETLVIKHPALSVKLAKTLTFMDYETLRAEYPSLSPEAREARITEKKKAVFITRIAHPLTDGRPHDTRTPDYDDWTKNGDLLVWHAPLGIPMELSSMGVRVDGPWMRNSTRSPHGTKVPFTPTSGGAPIRFPSEEASDNPGFACFCWRNATSVRFKRHSGRHTSVSGANGMASTCFECRFVWYAPFMRKRS